MTNILTSHTAKQFFGASAGMAIAGLVYFGIDQANLNIKGLLVSNQTISPTSDISINAKNVDDATLRRITSRAQTVALTLENSQQQTAATTPVNERAAQRGESRSFANSVASAFETAPTYANNPNQVITEEQRLSQRTARFAAAGSAPSTRGVELAGIPNAPVYVPQTVIQRVEVPVDREVIKEVIKEVPVVREVIKEVPRDVIREVIKEVPRDVIKTVIKEVPHDVIKTVIKEVPVYITSPGSEKGPTAVPYRDLSNSGPGLFMLIGSSAGLALQRVYRRKKTSM